MFPDYDVVLLTDHLHLMGKINGLILFQYQRDQKWLTVEAGLKHSKKFRNNFWFLTIARFLALEQYLALNPEEIINIESDVILSGDFPFEKFSSLKSHIAFPLVSENRGIASTVYIRNLSAANKIVNTTIKKIHENPFTTDMEILKNLYDDDPVYVYPLPMGPTPNYFFKKSISSRAFMVTALPTVSKNFSTSAKSTIASKCVLISALLMPKIAPFKNIFSLPVNSG